MQRSKLVRRSVALFVALTLWIVSYIPITAEVEAHLSFIARDIYANGILINNYQLNSPLVIRQGSTYVPLTSALGGALGFAVHVDEERRLILVEPTSPSGETVREADVACNLEHQIGRVEEDYVVAVVETLDVDNPDALTGAWQQIVNPVVWSLSSLLKVTTNEAIDLTPGTELLQVRNGDVLFVGDVPYIPLDVFRSSATFGWDAHFDTPTGLYISTDPCVPAANYYSHENASFIAGRAAYIRSVRPELSEMESYHYEYLFRHEATVYGIDQDLLMAVSRTECSFQAGIVSRYGPVGMMQILPKTAAAYGITVEQLKDPHINLEFGARYIRDRLWMFNGDVVKALSAYNQGVVAVQKGTHRTGYAEKCLQNQRTMRSWLATYGYEQEFRNRVEAETLYASTDCE